MAGDRAPITCPSEVPTSATLLLGPTRLTGELLIRRRLNRPSRIYPRFLGTIPAPAYCWRSMKVSAKLTERVGFAIATKERRIIWTRLGVVAAPAGARREPPPKVAWSAELVPAGPSRRISRCWETQMTECGTLRMYRSLLAVEFGCTIILTVFPDLEELPVQKRPLNGPEQEALHSPRRSWRAFKLW